MALPTAVTIPNRYATASVAFTFTAAPTSPTAMPWLPGDIFLAYNSSADTGYTVTVVSNAKNTRSTVTINAESIAFGVYRVYPRFGPQDEDTLTVSASNAAVKFARLSTRAQPS